MSSDNTTTPPTTRAGFVCLAGPTNAGKSTLMNAMVGEKVAIITPKPQTTRNRILGIHTVPERGQIVFVDTPGFHRAQGRLGRRMNDVASRTLLETNLVVLVVDVSLDAARLGRGGKGTLHPANQAALERVREAGVPVFVVLNQVDKVAVKQALLPVIASYSSLLPGAEIVPISARTRDGLEQLEGLLFAALPESELLYPADILSDQAERFLAAEIVREKVMLQTHEELPYSVVVEVERWEEDRREDGGLVSIAAVIHVERDSQKGIVIGKGGARLKSIGTAARQELEEVLGAKVFLELFVHVEKDWSEKDQRLDRFGY
jgi:GTP-binding protein Era